MVHWVCDREDPSKNLRTTSEQKSHKQFKWHFIISNNGLRNYGGILYNMICSILQRVWKKCHEKIMNNLHWEKTNIFLQSAHDFTFHWSHVNKNHTVNVLTVLIESNLTLLKRHQVHVSLCFPCTLPAWNEEKHLDSMLVS